MVVWALLTLLACITGLNELALTDSFWAHLRRLGMKLHCCRAFAPADNGV